MPLSGIARIRGQNLVPPSGFVHCLDYSSQNAAQEPVVWPPLPPRWAYGGGMIRFAHPLIPEPSEWLPHLAESYATGIFSNFGPAVVRLQRALRERYGSPDRSAVLVANGTAGLVAALQALRVRGRVITPAFTFPATVHAILQAGCEPVLCDVDPTTWELSAHSIAPALDRPVDAIVHVRAFGFCRDLAPLERLAKTLRTTLVVDAAAAFGGRLAHGGWAGSQGDAEVFSLHATKPFCVGEGGVIMTHPQHLPAMEQAINFAMVGGDVLGPGGNGKMSELHAAVGLAVLAKIDRALLRRRVIFDRYEATMRKLAWYRPFADIGTPPIQTFPLLLPPGSDSHTLAAAMLEEGIQARCYYSPALHQTTAFSRYSIADHLPVTASLAHRVLCLPLHLHMSDSECQAVLDSLMRHVAHI